MCARSCKYISQARAASTSKHIHPQRKSSCHVWELGSLVTTCIKYFRITGAESQHPNSHYHLNAAWLFFWSTSHLLHYLGYCFFFFFFLPHRHLCSRCVCHSPVSRPDSAARSAICLITSANSTSGSDCEDRQPWMRVIIQNVGGEKKTHLSLNTRLYNLRFSM